MNLQLNFEDGLVEQYPEDALESIFILYATRNISCYDFVMTTLNSKIYQKFNMGYFKVTRFDVE